MTENVSTREKDFAKIVPLAVQKFLATTATVAGIFNVLFDDNPKRKTFVLVGTLLVLGGIAFLNRESIKNSYKYEIKYRSGRSNWGVIALAVLGYFLAIILSLVPASSEFISQKLKPIAWAFNDIVDLSSENTAFANNHFQSIAILILVLFGVVIIQSIILIESLVENLRVHERTKRYADIFDVYITSSLSERWSNFWKWLQQQSWDTTWDYKGKYPSKYADYKIPESERNSKRKAFLTAIESLISVSDSLEFSGFSNGIIKIGVLSLSKDAFTKLDENKELLECAFNQYIESEILNLKKPTYRLVSCLSPITFDMEFLRSHLKEQNNQ